ncbi:MAG: ABC transporter permease [Planctomycetes bacterium]|nr:ABC transporter permease [Planctomycetota bacterium]
MYRRFLSVRYFRTRLVNWLSVAGVMVGVAVMIVVWSVFSGFQVEVRKAIRGSLADVELRPMGDEVPPTWPELSRLLEGAPGVVAAVPRLTTYIAHPFKTARSDRGVGESFHFLTAVGVDWAAERAALDAAKARGAPDATGLPSFLLASDDPARPFFSRAATEKWGDDPTIVTGMFSLSFLRMFRGEREAAKDYLGEIVDLALVREATTKEGEADYRRSNFKVYVASVYDGRDQEADLRRVFIDRALLWSVSRPVPASPRTEPVGAVPYTEVGVTVDDYERATAVREGLRGFLRAHGVPGFEMLTWQDQRASVLRAVSSERAMLAIVIAFIGLLAGFTILATLTLTVVEKTRDIGVLLALGATAPGILAVFLRSGVLIGALGGALGLALGVALTHALNPFRLWLRSAFDVDLFPADIYLFDSIPYVFDWTAIAWIAGGCVVLAFFAGLLPAVRASRMDPVVALRHE